MVMGAGSTGCGATGVIEVTTGCCCCFLEVATVSSVHLLGLVVVVLLSDLLGSHLMLYIPFLPANSTSFPSIFSVFSFYWIVVSY